MSTIVTVRVPRKAKETLEKHKVNISEVIRKLLESYIRDLELRDLAEKLEDLRTRIGEKLEPSSIAEIVRQDRESR